MIKFERHPEIAISASEFATGKYKTWYSNDYGAIMSAIASRTLDEREALRALFLTDLWFMVRFGMSVVSADHPFVVEICRDIESGPQSGTLDVYAREHFKSTVITQGETLQRRLREPDKCTGIFAYARPAAKAFLRSIKILCEQSDLLKWCFPEVLWAKPEAEAPKWAEDDGLIFKRKNNARKESTIEAWGLIEGMPTGRHFDDRVYDDIETDDIRESPDMLRKCYDKFEMSDNLGVDGGTERVIGTFYSHYGPIKKIQDKKRIDGTPMYLTRIRAATHDGTKDGNPVLLSQERLDKLKMSVHFNSQQLCNPTPDYEIKLDFAMLQPIEPRFMPKNRLKFVLIDPAGDDAQTKGVKNDSWAMGCISVEPVMDDLGTSKIFIEDAVCDSMSLNVAVDAAVGLYLRNGRITGVGIERVGTDSAYEHVRKALLAKGRYVKIKKTERDDGNMILLSPDGKSKTRRIESALSWPWNNGKIYYSTRLPASILDKLREECAKFPLYHVDFLDMIAYIYKVIEMMRFNFRCQDEDTDDEDETLTGRGCGHLSPLQGKSAVTGY